MGLADYIKTGLPKLPRIITVPLLYCNLLKEQVYGSAFQKVKRALPDFDPDARLVEMANYAIANVPYYRKRYQGTTITSVDDFREKIQFIDKTEVKAHWDEFIADGADLSKTVTARTGGTCSEPMKLLIPANRYATEMNFVTRIWKRAGWDYDRRATIRNHHLPAGVKYRVNPATKELIFDAFRSDDGYIRFILRTMRRHRTHVLYSYPSTATAFLQGCLRLGLDTSFIKIALLTSEEVTPLQFHFLHDRLGLKVSSFFGHTEKLVIAGNDGDCMQYVVEPKYGFCEIIDEHGTPVTQAGATGEIIGSTLHNHYMPLLRYRTGDYATYGGETIDTDGSRKPVLSAILGRHNQSLIHRADGTTVAETALNLHNELYEHISALQYIQERPGFLTLLIVKGQGFTARHEQEFRRVMGQAMGGEQYIDIRYADAPIRQPNGKLLSVISKIAE